MEIWVINNLCVFGLSVLLAGILIPKILLIAFAKNLYDDHDERKIHRGAVPRLGGLAFTPVITFSITLVMGVNLVAGRAGLVNHIGQNSTEMCFQFCGLTLLYLVGIADDLIGVRYRAKFVVQIFSSILLIVGGVWIDNLYGILGIYEIPVVIGYLLTILSVVFFTNAINLIDGVDGLASGLSIGAAIVYGFAFIFVENYMYAALAFGILGVLIPFFYYNVFGNVDKGKKIFMGDTGSLTLGFMLSILSIKLLMSSQRFESPELNPFVVAFAPLLIPCLDVLRVFFRRIRKHKSPFLPDRIHIHHKLMAVGLSSRVTMVSIVGASVLVTFLNLLFSTIINVTILIFLNIFVWVSLNMWLSKTIRKKGLNKDF